MSSFAICLNAIAPLFLMMATGYGAKRAGIIHESDVARINAISFKIFMPMMCFYNVYDGELSSVLRPRLLLFTAIAILVEFALSWIFAARFIRDKASRGVVVQGLYRSNYMIVGLPFALELAGDGALGAAIMVGAVTIPLFNILAVISLEVYHNGEKPRIGGLLRDVAKNPLIIGTFVGLIFLLLHVRLPAVIESAVRDMSKVTSPLMLFLLGAFFHFDGFKRRLAPLIAVCAGRLLVLPAFMLTIAALLGFRGNDFVPLIALFASSTATASFTMAQQMGGDAELAGDIVVLTSALCVVTLFGWGMILKAFALY